MFLYNGFNLAQDSNDIEASFSIEYLDALNSSKYFGFKFGSEISVIEFLKLRFGYYSLELQRDKHEELTYGIGLNIPFYKLLNFPIVLAIDYLNLNQPAFKRDEYSFEFFTIKVNYILN